MLRRHSNKLIIVALMISVGIALEFAGLLDAEQILGVKAIFRSLVAGAGIDLAADCFIHLCTGRFILSLDRCPVIPAGDGNIHSRYRWHTWRHLRLPVLKPAHR